MHKKPPYLLSKDADCNLISKEMTAVPTHNDGYQNMISLGILHRVPSLLNILVFSFPW